MTTFVARLDPALVAVVRGLRPLRAAPDRVVAGADPVAGAADLPGRVRAASAIRRWLGQWAVVQDDVHALSLHRRLDGVGVPLLLPPGADGRRSFGDSSGNKHHKMDLEAATVLPDQRLLVLGSGSAATREVAVLATPGGGAVRVALGALYARVRAVIEREGEALNLEGCVVVDGALRLFQRGNGAAVRHPDGGGATVDLDLAALLRHLDAGGPPPCPERLRRYDLGAAAGVAFGFTDAVALADGRVAFIAAAEASPNAVDDGAVVGCRFGVLDRDGSARVADIVDGDGQALTVKLEGIERDGAGDGAGGFVVVADVDDETLPGLVGALHVDGL